ncbi:hypothetical protein [Serratia marcescens]|uniref:hypothetical protein n=1 Tax=Serratia marcescens TaxID=615 RepID=UPI0020A533ED|nr:hypothetical protein [Serratia marcescens]
MARIMPQRGAEIAGSFGDILSGEFTPFAGGHWLAYKKSARFALHSARFALHRFILKRISMKSAKQIANEMADAVNIDSNLVRGFAQGFISVPVDFYYLGYDYIDNENR